MPSNQPEDMDTSGTDAQHPTDSGKKLFTEHQQDNATQFGIWSVFKTVSTYLTAFSLGMVAVLHGPSLLDLVQLFQIDIKTFGVVFTVRSVGLLTGGLLCGALYDRLNPEILFGVTTCLLGVLTICAPWGDFVMFVTLTFCQNACSKLLDSATQAYIIEIWTDTKLLRPVLQGMHLLWSLGATISPLVIEPFLMAKLTANANRSLNGTLNVTLGHHSVTYAFEMNTNALDANRTSITKVGPGSDDNTTELDIFSQWLNDNQTDSTTASQDHGQLNIRYAFMVIGCLCLIITLLFMSAFAHQPKPIFRKRQKKSESQNETTYATTKDSNKFRYVLLIILFFFYVSYFGGQGVLGSFIAAYVVEGLGWDKFKGSVITSVLWGSMTVGRLIGIPMSAVISPRKMAYGNAILTAVASGIMLVSTYTTDILTWIGVSLTALALSTIYTSTVLWAQDYIVVDGKAISLFVVASTVGFMSGPPLLGYLFETFSHMWFLYFILGSSIMNILIFVLADLVASGYKKRVESNRGPEQLTKELMPTCTPEVQPLQTNTTQDQDSEII